MKLTAESATEVILALESNDPPPEALVQLFVDFTDDVVPWRREETPASGDERG